MRRLGLVLLLCSLAVPAAADETLLGYDVRVRLEPASHLIEAETTLALPSDLGPDADGAWHFVLHRDLAVTRVSDGWSVAPLEGEPDARHFGVRSEVEDRSGVPLREYALRRTGREGEAPPLRIAYRGTVHHPLVAEAEEYARSFSRTPGTISEEGVVLSDSAAWLPAFGDRLVTFRLEVDLPETWDAVSQGGRGAHAVSGGRRRVTWDSPQPMDDVYLIAAPFVEYSRPAGDAIAYAFLRSDDPNLAARYLEATAQYLEMYRRLIGPYPYGKFALVENFWDTGYGMPSFTLLGPRIIRFPFILHSSYPHEILHNWWGNGVFVDYDRGNWCEGLTAYLADHLVKEGQGQGAEYRRDALEKYRSFVRGERDFPLTEFRARHSSATEAVGYGKSLMAWHMLRRRIGDDAFSDGLRRFYRSNRFRQASFTDLEAAFGEAAGEDLGWFFRQWVERTGAPGLALGSASARETEDGGHVLSLELVQAQDGPAYRLDVPIAITLEGEGEARVESLEVDGASTTVEIPLDGRPLRVDVDAEFDLFRRLDLAEVPATFGRLFGAERVTIVVPAADDVATSDWQAFAKTWAESDDAVEVVGERDIERLPAGRAVWVLGARNRWSSPIESALARYGAGAQRTVLRTGESELPRAGHCFAFTVRHPENPELALGWIGADVAAALPGLARKLPHYGKYSFLAFSGEEPANVAKGQWPVVDSPLARTLGSERVARGTLPTREPLARLEPVFDPSRLAAHVRALAADEMEGRGVGTAGLDAAADYVAEGFRGAGLEPGGDGGTYFQEWTEPGGPGGEPVTLRNVIGVLPGTDPQKGGSVIVGAHYDHLGHGWPDVHSGDEGRIHPGADDNASGVAVLLELAGLLGRELKPQRPIVFVAFSGEEWGLRGSKHYVRAMRRWPVADALAMINLDTVGRLRGQPITVFGTGTATEWVHIVRGIGFTTGIQAKSVPEDLGGSDQKSFQEAGIPAVQIFSGAHEDYHRPGDRAELVDVDGLVQVATFVREAVVYLSEREPPLTSTLTAGAPPAPAAAGEGGRKVSLGTLPDFAFPGPGVRIEQVLPDTPASRAGLEPGDRIVAIDGEAIADVRAYAAVLRARSAGDTLRIEIERGGEKRTVEATLVAR